MGSYVDLNADLGESFGAYKYGADQELLPLVTSANIACGWHGGDPGVMRNAVALAVSAGTAIGAHPGYPDLMGFGRRNMTMATEDVTDAIIYQIGALDGFCRAQGAKVSYVKPHGALYNMAAKDPALAKAVAQALSIYDPRLVLLCPSGSAMERAALEMGIRTAREFFADRGYMGDGSLVPRSQQGAVISDSEAICDRVLRAVRERTVETADGGQIRVELDSICLHGDNPAAVKLAVRIKETLQNAGVELKAFAGGE